LSKNKEDVEVIAISDAITDNNSLEEIRFDIINLCSERMKIEIVLETTLSLKNYGLD
jgi:hypothetical protein